MTGLRAGQLSRRLRLQSRSSSQDSFGGPNLAWVDVATIWAEIRPITGRELENARRIASEVSHQILVRYQPMLADPKVVAGFRALYRGRIFNIHASLNEDERNSVLTLLASEGMDDG